MNSFSEFLKGKKTYFLGIAAMAHGFYLIMTGDMPLMDMLNSTDIMGPINEMFGGGLIMTMRAALDKLGIKR